MTLLKAFLILLLVDAAFGVRPSVPLTSLRDDGTSSRQRSPPSWPSSYSVKYLFSLPYTSEIQSTPIAYDVAVYRQGASDTDGKGPRVRMEVRNGSNVLIATKEVQYELEPRLDRQVCRVFENLEPGDSMVDLQALPDVEGWTFGGTVQLGGQGDAILWRYEHRHEAKLVEYNFFVGSDGTPLKLHMLGNDLFSGAHYDEWVVQYTEYVPDKPDDKLFERPAEKCQSVVPGLFDAESGPEDGAKAYAGQPIDSFSFSGIRSHRARMESLLPHVRYGGDAQYDAFLLEHAPRRRHSSLADYNRRKDIFSANVHMIDLHNKKPDRTFTMTMNRFGDWTREERLAVLLPRRLYKNRNTLDGARTDQVSNDKMSLDNKGLNPHEIPYQTLTDMSKLPSSIDWRGTGAEGRGVLDQANCGSCWAFGAVGAMEAAWWMATGQRAAFSVQQVMDCAWGYVEGKEESASACDGGDAWAGVGHIVEAGGLALADEYPYLGVSDYCREPQYASSITASGLANEEHQEGDDVQTPKLVGRFKGYMRIPQYNDTALMEAVFSRGPVAVSLDASQDSFAFYSAGVYYDTSCMWKPDELDHSMMLVGYGTDVEGDYWLIRNSWSTHWGDRGYIKVARDNHGCGAATDAIAAVVDEEAANLAGKNTHTDIHVRVIA